MTVFRAFLALAVLEGLLFEDARLLFFLVALTAWALDRLVVVGLAPLPGEGGSTPRRARLRAVARALAPPAAPVVLLLLLALPSIPALFAWRDAHADHVRKLPEAGLRDGLYTGEGEGLRGPVRVGVIVRDGKLADVRILEQSETLSLGGNAIEELRAETLDTGRPPQRLVTGATHASQGFRDALHQALVAAAFGSPDLPAHARLFLFLTRNRIRFSTLNDLVACLLGAALLAGVVGRPRPLRLP